VIVGGSFGDLPLYNELYMTENDVVERKKGFTEEALCLDLRMGSMKNKTSLSGAVWVLLFSIAILHRLPNVCQPSAQRPPVSCLLTLITTELVSIR
jgi:hypothetical protein